MYLLCIPNHDKTRLINANVIYAKQVNDIPMSKKSHLPSIKKSISDDQYHYTTLYYNKIITAPKAEAVDRFAVSTVIKISIHVPGQPPEMTSSLA